MFNSVVLDVVIGLVFVYLLYSLLATIVQELIASKFDFRSELLEKAIARMLEDGNTTDNSYKLLDRFEGLSHIFGRRNRLVGWKFVTWFYAHPLIKYLGEDNFYSKPAYLSAQNFSKVIVDLLKGFSNTASNDVQLINDSIQAGTFYHLPIDIANDKRNPAIEAIRTQLKSDLDKDPDYKIDATQKTFINADTKLFLQSLWRESNADIDTFKKKLEDWYNDTMERTTGWYKRYTKLILFIVGLTISIGFNVDTIMIAKKLTRDPKLREQVIQAANTYLEKNKQLGEQLKTKPKTDTDYASTKAQYDSLAKNTDSLFNAATAMVNGDIKNVNQMMGLGWKTGIDKNGEDIHGLNKDQWWLTAFIGWLITALAISLGAPFWFDMLNKLMKLRGTGGKSGEKDGTASTAQLQAQQQSQAPVSVNVNTQTDSEAVG